MWDLGQDYRNYLKLCCKDLNQCICDGLSIRLKKCQLNRRTQVSMTIPGHRQGLGQAGMASVSI